MKVEVINHEISVGSIRTLGVSSSSLIFVGDADTIQLNSLFNTPAESLIIGPFVPLVPQG